MAQFGYPATDITTGGSLTGTVLDIDEGATPNDSDAIYGENGTNNVVGEFKFGTLNDPNLHTGHILRWRHAQADSDAGTPFPSSGGTTPDYDVGLYDGATLIQESTGLTPNEGSFVEGSFTLTEANASQITDYTDLRIRVTLNGSGGNPNNRRTIAISWAELEIPDVNNYPETSQITPDLQNFGTDQPELEFSGSDADSDDLQFRIEIDANADFDSGITVGEQYAAFGASYSIHDGIRQQLVIFNLGAGETFAGVTFRVNRAALDNKNIRAVLYAATGTIDTDAVPTGSKLAVSKDYHVDDLPTSVADYSFHFETPYVASSGLYAVGLECDAGAATSNVLIQCTLASGSSSYSRAYGNEGNYTSAVNEIWFQMFSGGDRIEAESETDAGFVNKTNGGDTQPFNAGDTIGYTVQAGDALANGTYYWRVKTKDPSGTNFWSKFGGTRSFDVNVGGSTLLVVQDASHNHTADGNLGLTQKNTLAVQETTHNHEADNVDLTQKNTLVVSETTHNHTADAVILGVGLVPDETTHTHTADNVDLVQKHTLVVLETTHNHTADNVDLTQKNTLVVSETTHNHTADSVVLGVGLIVQETSHVHTADSTILGVGLIPDETTHTHTADNVVLGVGLVPNDASHTHTADNVDLTQKFTLVVQEVTHKHTADNVELSLTITLTVQETTHKHTAENVDLTQKHTLVVSETSHTHTTENVALTQDNVLVVDETTHTHTADAVILGLSLIPDDTSHVHTADNIDLTQKNILVVAETSHTHTAENVDLLQDYLLVVQETTHKHTAENVTLSLSVTLVVQDGSHDHTADGVNLVQDHTLSVDETSHTHTAENVTLGVHLLVDETTHNHTAENVDLQQGYLLVVSDTSHPHTSENVDLVQDHILAIDEAFHVHTADAVVLIYSGQNVYKLHIGTGQVEKVYLATDEIKKIYLGSDSVFEINN